MQMLKEVLLPHIEKAYHRFLIKVHYEYIQNILILSLRLHFEFS